MGLFFFCGKVYIVMYFFVSIRFHIRYFLDLPLSMCSYEKVFYEKSIKVSFLYCAVYQMFIRISY